MTLEGSSSNASLEEPDRSGLVSVYMPTRGRPDLVKRAVESVQSQHDKNWELRIVIDGRDEATEAVLGTFAADSRIHVESLQERGGACRARNVAIESARGDYITGLDDDDEFRPGHLSLLRQQFVTNACSFVCTTAVHRRSGSDTLRHPFTGPVPLGALIRQNVVGNQVLTRTRYLKELGGFDPNLPAWQDFDLWVRLCEKFGSGYRVDGRTYVQHLDHDEERISSRERIEEAYRMFVQKHEALLDEQAKISLELLMIATTHRPVTGSEALRFLRAGLYRRTASAFLSNRFPIARSWVRKISSIPASRTPE